MKKAELKKKLLTLAEAVGTEITENRADIYWEIFKDYPDEELTKALNLSLKTNKFFPKPAELIELIEGSPSDKSLQAWQAALNSVSKVGVYNSPKFEDKIITAIILDMGGWEAYCNMPTKENPWKEKEFRERYNFYLRHPIPQNTPEYLAGLSERANQKFPDYIPKPILVQCPYLIRRTLVGYDPKTENS